MKRRAEAHDAIAREVDGALESLRSRYPSVEDSQFEDATRSVTLLGDSVDLDVLRANRSAVAGAVLRASDVLDTLVATREVRHVRVSDVWAGAISSEEELETALSRLREAVLAQLSDETEVRFR